jgi:hypothetical protein
MYRGNTAAKIHLTLIISLSFNLRYFVDITARNSIDNNLIGKSKNIPVTGREIP